jgi:hypothetical protein
MPTPLIWRFMSAFGKSVWGHAVDKAVELILGIGPFVAIVVRSNFSVQKIVAERNESLAIIVISFSALIVYHAARSAYAVSTEIAERARPIGFTHFNSEIKFPRTKLYGIASFVGVVLVALNLYLWEHVPRVIDDPFTVAVEWARFSVGGKEYGTSLWVKYPSKSGGCGILFPIRGAYFLSIKNNRNVPVPVVGYTIDVMGQPLMKVQTGLGTIIGTPNSIDGHFFHPEWNVSNFRPGQTFDIKQGSGFSMVRVPINQSDYSRAINLKMDLIDDLLKSPLQPGIPIRGWTFFQAKNENVLTVAGAGHVTLETDDSKTFSYSFDLRNPHPELDNMDRIIKLDSLVDLSDCEHP